MLPPRKKVQKQMSTPESRVASLEERENSVRRQYKQDLRRKTKFTAAEKPHIIEMIVILKLAGYTQDQIGQVVGCSRGQVHEFLDEPEAQELLVELRREIPQAALALLRSYGIEAVQTLASIMRETRDDQIRLKAAIEILDRTGLPKTTKSEASVHTVEETRTTFTDEGITDALRECSPEVQEEAAQLIERLEKVLEKAADQIEEEVIGDDE